MKNRLLQLLADNRGRGTFRAEADADADEATIYLYDAIVDDDYWGGVSALSFVRELNAISAPVIHLRINSPGGDVFAARSMERAVREHASKIIAHVDGYAASAASYLAVAADEVTIAPGGFFMIHKAWSIVLGNADEIRETAALLDQIDATLVATYAQETGQDPADIAAWMAEEKWIGAEEAIELGFADRLAEDAVEDAAAWNFAAYKDAPKVAPDRAATATPAPASAPAAEKEPVTFDRAAAMRRIEVATLI